MKGLVEDGIPSPDESAEMWARAKAEALFHHFATRRTENRPDDGPESIVCFCVLSKENFIQWATEFFQLH